jgi:hypothetical protein
MTNRELVDQPMYEMVRCTIPIYGWVKGRAAYGFQGANDGLVLFLSEKMDAPGVRRQVYPGSCRVSGRTGAWRVLRRERFRDI